ncbi:unnamed protein product [Ambrosiozyma monospora]|uniref:Unnamed protein product n=1 Tax=Ambrosiozyma monospora TaxID=43982 RepID=A0ACB5T8J0_AMBMO|nr:unnamed protein product [Ambrosiozyma monospora]
MHPNNHISNLSAGLRNVHLSAQNQQQQQQPQPLNINQSQLNQQNSIPQAQQYQFQQQPITSQTIQNQYEQETSQQLDDHSVSKLKLFFENTPDEGYTLISHRSAPNGFKIAVVLSELGFNYNTILLDFNKGEQRTPEFLTINPNGRVPALIDHTNPEQQVSIWESVKFYPGCFSKPRAILL